MTGRIQRLEKNTKIEYFVQKDGVSKVAKYLSRGCADFLLDLTTFFAVFVLKLISIQFSLFISFLTVPIRLSYSIVMFPFRTLITMKKLLIIRLLKMCIQLIWRSTSYIYARVVCNKSIITIGLKFSQSFLCSAGACFVLVGMLFSAILVGGIATRCLVEQPIQTTEILNFDYTKINPVALVSVNLYNQKLRLTVALTLPESEYNRNLGMFQVRVELLSANGKVTASSSHPCILKFKSPPIRFIETLLKTAPLIAGFQTESQILKIKINDLAKEYKPARYLKIVLEQRAEYNDDKGIPQIYDASLTIKSELNKLKRIVWFSRRIIFVLISIFAFWTELGMVLIFLRCYGTSRGRVKAE